MRASSSLSRRRRSPAPYAARRDPNRPDPSRIPICAVVDCPEVGHRHVCPADGSAHGHGRIHYADCHTALPFREGWRLLCDAHFRICADARRAWEAMRKSGEIG